MRNAILTTYGGTAAGHIEFGDTGDALPFTQQDVAAGVDQTVNYTAPIYFPENHVIMPLPNSNTGKMLFPMNLVAEVGSTNGMYLTFHFDGCHDGQIQVKATCYGDSFNLIHEFSAVSDSEVVNVYITSALATNFNTYWSIDIISKGAPWSGVAKAYLISELTGGPWVYGLENFAQHMLAYDIRDSDTLLNNAEKYFVLGQSLLCTADMSTINDGGVIATARLPGGSVVGEKSGSIESDSWYEWVSSLPYNSYDGPVKRGSYSYYLPEDERGFFYRDVEEFFNLDLPYLVSEFTAADTTESTIVRIKVCTIVQFTTNASLYSLAPSDYYRDVKMMHHILSEVHAAYSNDGHKAGLRRHLSYIGEQIKNLLRNPETYTTAAKILATLPAFIA